MNMSQVRKRIIFAATGFCVCIGTLHAEEFKPIFGAEDRSLRRSSKLTQS